jgi:GntR family transcriptional regulator
MEINRDSKLPLYYQLKEILKEEIDIGKYKPGDRVPSENEFASMLNISRNTAKQAIADLVSEGVLYRIQGKGTFVSDKKMFSGIMETFSFSEDLKNGHLQLTTRVIFAEEIVETKETIQYLKLKESTHLFRIQRLRLLNDIPVALQTSYIPKFFCPDLLKYDLSVKSLYDILHENYNISFSSFSESLSCVKADQYESAFLKVKKDSPLFFLTRKTYTKNDEIIEVVRSFMPGDRCEFNFSHGKQFSIELNHFDK